jgi:nucleoside-diphosphate-sugar epimerase
MRVLLTGPFGNIGSHTTAELIRQGHQVRAFDLRTPRTEKVAQRFGDQIEVRWGDLRKTDDVRAALENREVIIHLAAVIPPRSDEQPEMAEQVNVD